MRRPRLLLPAAAVSSVSCVRIHARLWTQRPYHDHRSHRGRAVEAEEGQPGATRPTLAPPALRGASLVVPTPWSQQLTGPLTRVTLSEIAACCLSQEGKSLYAVHKPLAPASGRPDDFARLIHALAAAGLVEPYGRRVSELFLELLQKPLHPERGVLTPWDLSDAEMTAFEVETIEAVMAASDPMDALNWLGERVLTGPPARQPNVAGEACSQEMADRCGFAASRYMLDVFLRPHSHSVAGPKPRSLRLLLTRNLVAAVASALFRTGDVACKHEAMLLLEQAALARLTNRFQYATLFDEHVAVQCAEAAATVGDSETVARLMFLLYRTKGALGSSSLPDHGTRGGRVGRPAATAPPPSQGAPIGARASTSLAIRQWWGSLWPFQRSEQPMHASVCGRGEAAGITDEEALFESAAIRLLKSAIRAALYNTSAPAVAAVAPAAAASETIGGSAPLYDAYALFDALRPGTSWAGTAGMAVELLLFISSRLQKAFASLRQPMAVGPAVPPSSIVELQQCALRALHSVLRDASRSAPCDAVRNDVIAYCVRLTMEAFVYVAPLGLEESHAGDFPLGATTREIGAVPLALMGTTDETVAAAEIVLGLFSHVTEHRHQKQLLPLALGAAVSIFQIVARDGSLPVVETIGVLSGMPRALVDSLLPARGAERASPLASLCAFFTHVESPAWYVAASPPEKCSTTTVAGALILHLSLLLAPSHQLCEATAPLAARLCSGGDSADASTLARPEWFSIAGAPQRMLLWNLLSFLAAIRQSSTTTPSTQQQLFLRPHSQIALVRAVRAITARTDCSQEELGELVRCIYANGVQMHDEDPAPSPDPLLTRYLGFTVLSSSARGLADELAKAVTVPAVSSPQVVVFVSAATLAEEQGNARREAPLRRPTPLLPHASVDADYLSEFVRRVVDPLVSDPLRRDGDRSGGLHGPDAFVTFVVSGEALLTLRDAPGRPCHEGRPTLAASLLRSLGESAPPLVMDRGGSGDVPAAYTSTRGPRYRVVVARPAQHPPSRLSEHQQLFSKVSPNNRDGVLEARELARALADVAPQALSHNGTCAQSVVLYLWNESVTTLTAEDRNGESEVESLKRLLGAGHVQLLSVRRAQAEKTKRDIGKLLRAAATSDRTPAPHRSAVPTRPFFTPPPPTRAPSPSRAAAPTTAPPPS